MHGALPPAHFIAIAEERGMIGLLGDWVLREAARFAADDRAAVDRRQRVAAAACATRASPTKLLDILAEAGLAPPRLQIEITESVLLENSDGRRRTVLADSARRPASASRSTISAPAIRRSTICAATPSTS